MAISKPILRQAIKSLSSIEGLAMNPKALAEDVVLLSYAFPEEEDFKVVCANTQNALQLLIDKKVLASSLKYEFEDWKSYHYQPRVGQGIPVSCRIMFRETEEGIEVKGFSHRRIPNDFYQRMSEVRNK